TCGADTYHLHKTIVCTRSEFFKRSERFTAGKEAAENKVDLPEDDPSPIKVLIQYLYENEHEPKLPTIDKSNVYTEINIQSSGTWTPSRLPSYRLPTILQMWSGFCEICCPNYVSPFQGLREDSSQLLLHARMYKLGDKYTVIDLKELAREKLSRACEHFAPAVRCAFSTTPDTNVVLRSIIINVPSKHVEISGKPDIEILLHEFNDPAVGLPKRRTKQQI
ncbi:hypothetical protein BU25DRAFT_351311, partial [Macroventuria anomochaeta]